MSLHGGDCKEKIAFKSIFGSHNTQFYALKNESINTLHFLNASQVFYPFFDSLGKVFTPVKNDITGNITKLRKKYNENPKQYLTLQDMLLTEIAENKEYIATESLLWLKRGLEYVQAFLHLLIEDCNLNNPGENLVPNLKKAYSLTLKQYHNRFIQQLFNLLAMSVPYRKDLFRQFIVTDANLSDENDIHIEKVVMFDIQEWVKCLDTNLNIINAFYAEYDLEKLFN